ncbi:uncharacterized protein LOC129756030 [Uranotaenia lowii]|uniref:uncharacterized protein LOC129756030 n=1 Tax=Uranotaenia lowii TaxID=190385 RepID=UPI00247A328E|nr:uncharacterized protein LOC129756030 [Uranotaenia lowii]
MAGALKLVLVLVIFGVVFATEADHHYGREIVPKSEKYNIDAQIANATSDGVQRHSRKKRFLLFPVNANILVTVSGGKAPQFRRPSGYSFITELDLYHPLPDYKYRITQLKLNSVAMYPPEPTKPTEPPATTAAVEEHHDGHDLTPMELEQYLKDHPETYVPPEYNNNDRSDRFQPGTYNPYGYGNGQSYPLQYSRYWKPYQQPYKSKLWQTYPDSYYQQSYRKMKRSVARDLAAELQMIEEEEDRFNISHHRNWEHFYHYRERRELYSSVEEGVESRLGITIKYCILRSICEARSFLLPPGRSMIMDILRIIFTVPLKDELNDDYSSAMRQENLDCHQLYGKDCPISILYLILFGKFTP